MSETPVVSSNTIVHLNVNLDADDIVAIKISKIETHCLATEQALQAQMKKVTDERNKLTKKIEDLANEKGIAAWQDKANKLAIALGELKGYDVDVRLSSSMGYSYGCNKENRINTTVSFGRSGSRDERNFLQFSPSIAEPKCFNNMRDGIKALDQEIADIQDKLTKCRNAMGKLSTLERHCRAQLASKRLHELGRDDILASLDDVTIPGMPELKLALPAPKK